jgi:hypothetical protein
MKAAKKEAPPREGLLALLHGGETTGEASLHYLQVVGTYLVAMVPAV